MTALHEAIRAGVLAALRTIHTGMPGKLEKYDPATGRAHVKPLIQEPDPKGELRSLPVITGVPVAMMGGGAASLYLPPEVGDTGWLSFSHRSLELWLERGGDAAPGDPRILDMTDAVFFPGLRPFAAGSLAEEADAAVLKNGTAKLKIRGNKVALGTAQAELLDLLDQLLTQLTTPGSVTVAVAGASGVGGLTPANLTLVQTIQTKLTLIRGSL